MSKKRSPSETAGEEPAKKPAEEPAKKAVKKAVKKAAKRPVKRPAVKKASPSGGEEKPKRAVKRPAAKRPAKKAAAPAAEPNEAFSSFERTFLQAEENLSKKEQDRRRRCEEARRFHKPDEAEQRYGVGRLPVWEPGWLLVTGARQNNLRSIDVPFPLSALTCVTGVSGSGKSSLIGEILCPALERKLMHSVAKVGAYDQILGADRLDKVIMVDQQPLGQTPSSTPATYTGVFDSICELFARLPESRMRSYTASRFRFNVPGGRCEKCEGAGQIKIEMHFLSDVWVTCEACGGSRYEPNTLEILYKGASIADVLNMPIARACALFSDIPPIARVLRTLRDVGLGYLTLGQSAPTLSGGEAQRVRLARELARPDTGRTLYILDEPTTGLHFDDIEKLLDVIHRLVDLGNTVIIVEHNLDVIKSADWLVDLGPEAGVGGGELVFAGTPEQLVRREEERLKLPPEQRSALPKSWTAEVLAPVLAAGPYSERPLFDPEEYRRACAESESRIEDIDIENRTTMPWESDGRHWHTTSRTSTNGTVCRWDGKILADTVDRIEGSRVFQETDWSHRSLVEILPERNVFGWFFQASTGEEWLLRMKFRVPRGTFSAETLPGKIGLKPLSERKDINLYGTRPRTEVNNYGMFQEVQLRVYDYAEIDTPAYWEFLERAIGAMERYLDAPAVDDSRVKDAPWRTLGKQWHLSPEGCSGESTVPKWDISFLRRILDLLEQADPRAEAVWTHRLQVPFYRGGSKTPWVVAQTKFCDYISIRLPVRPHTVSKQQLAIFGAAAALEEGDDGPVVVFRLRRPEEFNESAFTRFLKKTLSDWDNPPQQF
ncbi:MAG: hypothetical protein IJG02_00335 [Thermoguttaceae bacterium]|nr:hypothetical protein [Thermoguttaceae bacterium]